MGIVVTIAVGVDNSTAYRIAERFRALMLAEPTLLRAPVSVKWDGIS